jgi:hypothetical protein
MELNTVLPSPVNVGARLPHNRDAVLSKFALRLFGVCLMTIYGVYRRAEERNSLRQNNPNVKRAGPFRPCG